LGEERAVSGVEQLFPLSNGEHFAIQRDHNIYARAPERHRAYFP